MVTKGSSSSSATLTTANNNNNNNTNNITMTKMNNQQKEQQNKIINGVPVSLMEDLAMKFVLNAPQQELANPNRILFLIELAWWHYEDFSRKTDAQLPKQSLQNFAELLYLTIPQLKKFHSKAREIYEKFIIYKFSVPCAGAVLLNPEMDKVILVKGMGKGSSWGFPKGKINDGEKISTCAAREVEEEIGVNISSLRDENVFLFFRSKGETNQETTLFVIPGVSEQTHFATYTRDEISQICWHPIGNLNPGTKTKGIKYFGVSQFYQSLTQWVKAAKKKNIKIQNSLISSPMNSPGQFIAKQYVESDDDEDDYGVGGGFTSIESLETRFFEKSSENVYGRYDESYNAAAAAAFNGMESFWAL
jgi:mRNA-decapping enzyme subunit 2